MIHEIAPSSTPLSSPPRQSVLAGDLLAAPFGAGQWERAVPRKIMLLAPCFYDGGIERALEGKALWLTRRGHAVEIVVFEIRPYLSGRPNPLLERLRASDVRIRTLPVY